MLSRFTSPAARGALRDEEGLTLVEILVAGFVLSIAVLGLASVASASLVSVRDSRERDRSTAVVSSALEAVRAMEYDQIALRTGDGWTSDDLVEAQGGHHVLQGGDAPEQIWAAADGILHPYTCTAETVGCWFEVPEQSRARIRAFVTWYPDADARTSKRITIVGEWDEPSYSQPRRVRMSTLVSPATRGLPAPAFEIRPPADTSTLDKAWVADAVDEGASECFEHNLTNFGAVDRYDLAPGAGWTTLAPVTDGTYQNASWIVRAYFITDGAEIGTSTLMRAPAAAEPLRSPVALGTGESARIHLCYEPRPDGESSAKPAPGDVTTSTLTFMSVFDNHVQHQVQHVLTISDATSFTLFLHDEPGHAASHNRPWKHPRPSNQRFNFDQFAMTPTHPANLSPPRLTMFDYDVGVAWGGNVAALDPDGFSGLWLPASAVTIHGVSHTPRDMAAEWDYQFTKQTAPITFTGSATVRAWFRVKPLADGTTPPNSRMCMGMELVKLRSNGNPVNSPANGIVGRRLVEVAATASFQEQILTIPWEPGGSGAGGGNVGFSDKEYLRLRLWNASADVTPADPATSCVSFHVAYGADTRAARLIGALP